MKKKTTRKVRKTRRTQRRKNRSYKRMKGGWGFLKGIFSKKTDINPDVKNIIITLLVKQGLLYFDHTDQTYKSTRMTQDEQIIKLDYLTKLCGKFIRFIDMNKNKNLFDKHTNIDIKWSNYHLFCPK